MEVGLGRLLFQLDLSRSKKQTDKHVSKQYRIALVLLSKWRMGTNFVTPSTFCRS